MTFYDVKGNIISVNSDNILQGKKWLPIGDSIITQTSYRGVVTHKTGMTEISGGYAGGRQVAYSSGAEHCQLEFLDNIASGTPDVIVIALGTNDYGNDCPLGTISDSLEQTSTSYTFYGCYKKLINMLFTKYGYVPMVLITPFQRNNAGTNGAGLTLSDYADAICEIGKYYGIVVCDMFRYSGMPIGKLTDTSSSNYVFTQDGLHLSRKAGIYASPKIIDAIEYAYKQTPVECISMGQSASSYSLTSTTPVQIYVTLSPSSTTQDVVWVSGNTEVVTVEASASNNIFANLTAVASGNTTVTATCGNVTKTFSVTVTL